MTARMAKAASNTAEKAADATMLAAEAAQAQSAILLPDLVPDVEQARAGSDVLTGTIAFVSGVVAARDVRIWVRGPRGYYRGSLAIVQPGTDAARFTAAFHSGDPPAKSVGASLGGKLTDGENLIGVSWRVGDHASNRVYRSRSGKVTDTV